MVVITLMVTTTGLTNKYLQEHPSVKDCLRNNVINYSKLARRISKELGIEKESSVEAVLIACRRYQSRMGKETNLEDQIIKILKKTEMEIKNKIVAVVISKSIFVENLISIEKKIRSKADVFYVIEGVNVFTVIISEKYFEELEKMFKQNIVRVSKDLVMITLKSPESLENTSGVIAHFYSLFSENGINIVETMSCWTDTLFVISEKDIPSAMNFLKF